MSFFLSLKHPEYHNAYLFLLQYISTIPKNITLSLFLNNLITSGFHLFFKLSLWAVQIRSLSTFYVYTSLRERKMEGNLPRNLIVNYKKCNVALGYYSKREWEYKTFTVHEKYKNDEQCKYVAFLPEDKPVKITTAIEINIQTKAWVQLSKKFYPNEFSATKLGCYFKSQYLEWLPDFLIIVFVCNCDCVVDTRKYCISITGAIGHYSILPNYGTKIKHMSFAEYY